jgi:poly-beta-1,6-N-acetyl-D-glucosamine synthase
MSMPMQRYAVVTAAHNEAAFIERTCASMAAQQQRPSRWVIVDDASSDDTPRLLSAFAAAHPGWVEVVRMQRAPGRDFRHKVNAFNLGLARALEIDFDFIGNLDADIELPAGYYATMLRHFASDPLLGVAGGVVHSCIDGVYVDQKIAADSVAGAVQLFRRECFERIGGYRPLVQGGIDAAAEILARHAGWAVRNYPDVAVLEHRRTASATATPLKARLREGRRLYALGYAFSFFAARCVRRALEQPPLLGSATAMLGYVAAACQGEPHSLPSDVVTYLRSEQRRKLARLWR